MNGQTATRHDAHQLFRGRAAATDAGHPAVTTIVLRAARFASVVAAALLTGCATPQMGDEFTTRWRGDEIRAAPSFDDGQLIVATHYFYWYRYPTEHFYNDAALTDDALQDHFVDPARVDYLSVAWHAGELADVAEAGIDVLLPVYWGVPDNYRKADVAFSVDGLAPLQEAIDQRAAAGLAWPRIGLFYDTTTLLPEVRGEERDRYDLRTPEGKDLFYRTIRDFFDLVHPRFWATIEGRPIVVLYGSGFAVGHNQKTIDYVYAGFERDFGVRPFVIKDASWRFGSDAVTSWGAALHAPFIAGAVAQIGPGYNDSAVPGRSTPIRDREGGDYYRWSWEQVMQSDASIVLIETWNEHHEATGISETVEHGRYYIELTARYAAAWKAGSTIDSGIELRHADPLPRPPSAEGGEFAGRSTVGITFGPGGDSDGIRLVRGVSDGVPTLASVHGEAVVLSTAAQHAYLYFAVADPFYFDEGAGIVVEYEYLDDGHAWHLIQYDSHNGAATLSGAYTDSPPVRPGRTGQWRTARVLLPDARLANRQNGGADLRFAVGDGSLTLRRVVVRRLDRS